MDDKKNLDAWADAYLDQHRTAPAQARMSKAPPVPLEDLPPMVRLMAKVSGQEPDPEMLERLRRHQERHARVAKLNGTIMIVGLGLMCVFALVFLSGF